MLHETPPTVPAQAESVELRIAVAEREAEIDAATGEAVKRQRGSAQSDRIVLRAEQHRIAEANAGGPGDGERLCMQQRRATAVIPNAVLGGPDRGEPESLDELGLGRELPVQAGEVARASNGRLECPESDTEPV